MAFYKYKGIDGEGQNIAGRVSARSVEAAVRDLRGRNVQVFEIESLKASGGQAAKKGRPKLEDYAQMIEQLGVLSSAGVNILDAVETVGSMAPKEQMRKELAEVGTRLRQGDTLSDAMEDELPTLPRYVPNLLRMGEATGQFTRVANMISDQMTKAETLRREMRGALNYPIFLLSVGIIAVCFIFYFVVPRFATMVAGNEDRLPGFTKAVFNTGLAFRENFVVILAAIVGGVFLLLALLRTPGFSSAVSGLLDRAPLIGRFRKLAEEGGWLRVLGLSTEAGARLLDALAMATNASVSPVRSHIYRELEQNIRSGMTLTDAVQLNLALDPIAVNLIQTGEKAGELPAMLLSAADIYQKRLEARSKQLTELAEPVAILLISLIVGGVVVSLVTAMTSIYDIAV
ncbi:MAG: type II secretion system F family protein [Pseudomonadota bacterium]